MALFTPGEAGPVAAGRFDLFLRLGRRCLTIVGGRLEPPGASPTPEQTPGPAQPPSLQDHVLPRPEGPGCLAPTCLPTAHGSPALWASPPEQHTVLPLLRPHMVP